LSLPDVLQSYTRNWTAPAGLAAKIPDDQKEMILGGNLTKLLKL